MLLDNAAGSSTRLKLGAPKFHSGLLEMLKRISDWADPETLGEDEIEIVIKMAHWIGNGLGMTQVEVANALSISPATWSRLLKGLKCIPEDLPDAERQGLQRSTRFALISGLKNLTKRAVNNLSDDPTGHIDENESLDLSDSLDQKRM